MKREIIQIKNKSLRHKFIKKWFNLLIKASAFRIENISLSNSANWQIKNDFIGHRSGKFFKIVGLEWKEKNKIRKQPFIMQKEIGILGFLIRRENNVNQLLIQAKIEPGNVGTVQIAPTCQATESNATRAHGGEFPPYISYFIKKNKNIIYDKKQSEQGTRFYKKRNRNLLILTSNKIPLIKSHKWIEVKDLLYFLHVNYLINTDARSVLVCSPWELLVNREPFSCNKGGFGADLLKSYRSNISYCDLNKVESNIKALRTKAQEAKVIKLSELENWRLDQKGLLPVNNKLFSIKQIKVKISSREIPKWDQPIIESVSEGKVILFCARYKGILHFLFKESIEPGLYNKIELTPSLVIEPGEINRRINKKLLEGAKRVNCHQSEEGGRFYNDRNHFMIIDKANIFKPKDGHYWLTLKQIRKLLDEEGWFTNEARSIISLILYWL